MVLSSESATPDPLALWVLPVSNLAGVARHTLDALTAGIPGWRVIVLCPPGPLVTQLEARGIPVVADAFGPEHGLKTSTRTLRHTCRALRPTIVHSHLAYADIVSALTPLGAVRRVSTEHGISADDLVYQGNRRTSQLMRRVHQARLHRFDALIAVCQSTADTMRSNWHTKAPITVILNGFDPPENPPRRAPTTDPHVLSLSRLAPEKRIDALLEAFALLVRDHPRARLTVAGEGALSEGLEALTQRLGISESVDFPGFIDPERALAEADVVVQLSVWENCSYTLLDAIAAGCGVVASPVGGNAELLPARCLATTDITAAICRQAEATGQRPLRRDDWPTVAQMANLVGDTYLPLRRTP